MKSFSHHKDIGIQLAEKLKTDANQPNLIILALPRGGLPVAYTVARDLNVPLDTLNLLKMIYQDIVTIFIKQPIQK
ncbi:MAG: hypothetical protein K0U37_00125 [Gammaproteobacteria bacterium]|nr:hypothetical protein [Gammaproteobacteria bacterium]